MALVTLSEIMDLVIMIAAVGYIFKDMVRSTPKQFDPIKAATNINWHDFKFGILAAAPGIVIHEAAHKIVALSFGMQAVFHAAYYWEF